MSTQPSPRPDEPDVHLQFVYETEGAVDGGLVIDVCACATAARNFLRDWERQHSEELTACVVHDGHTHYPRLGTEHLWLWE